MSNRDMTLAQYKEIKRVTTFFFNLTIATGSKKHRATYIKWCDRETKAYHIYLAHMWNK